MATAGAAKSRAIGIDQVIGDIIRCFAVGALNVHETIPTPPQASLRVSPILRKYWKKFKILYVLGGLGKFRDGHGNATLNKSRQAFVQLTATGRDHCGA